MKNVAVMGLGYISKRVAQGVQLSKNAHLYALASRDINKAKIMAEAMGVEHAYTYEEMLQDDNIDLVYICTPNREHLHHIKMCMDHGFHVICEKPLCKDCNEVKEIYAYARSKKCFFLEAEKTIFTPLNTLLKKKIEEGVIGKLRMIDASYVAHIEFKDYDKNRWNFDPEYGGSSYDVGVYPLCFANFHANSDIVTHHIQRSSAHDLACDFDAAMLLQYENGIIATLRSSWDLPCTNRGILFGEDGYIEIENFWKNKEAYIIKNGVREKITVDMKSDFCGEIEHAVECIEQGLLESPILGEHGSLEIMKVLERS